MECSKWPKILNYLSIGINVNFNSSLSRNLEHTIHCHMSYLSKRSSGLLPFDWIKVLLALLGQIYHTAKFKSFNVA